ncbi:MAG: hypothetical protein ACLGPL_01435 [Acidobacteriota bacterium]
MDKGRASLRLTMDEEKMTILFGLLQRGFPVEVPLGRSVAAVLCEEIGISRDYVEDRIQTIFLDGKAVDAIDSAIVESGSTLALSAAMPGVVGATFRRGGHFAPMRAQITHHGEKGGASKELGTFTLKLFNLVVKEIGPIFLERGVLVEREILEQFLKDRSADFLQACRSAEVNGAAVAIDDLPRIHWPDGESLICLQAVWE